MFVSADMTLPHRQLQKFPMETQTDLPAIAASHSCLLLGHMLQAFTSLTTSENVLRVSQLSCSELLGVAWSEDPLSSQAQVFHHANPAA